MSELTKELVEHVAHLARLELSEEEKKAFAKDMASILEFAQQVNTLDDELSRKQVAPMSNVLSIHNVFREDEVHESIPVEEALKNAADHKHQQVKVPSILEDE